MRAFAPRLLAAISLAATFGAPAALAGGQVTVKLPCDRPGLRSCDEMLNGSKQGSSSGLGAIGAVGALQQLKQRVKEQLDGNPSKSPPLKGYYQNVDPNPMAPTGPQASFGPTVCSLVGGTDFVQNPEIDTDHNGKSCGDFVTITVHYDVDTVLGCAVDKPTVYPPVVDMTPPKGNREMGWMRGGLVAATSCYYYQVVGELANNHSITSKDFGAVPDPCKAIAQDAGQASQQLDGLVSGLSGQLTGQQNINDIVNCTATDNPNPDASGAPDPGQRRQSAQILCAARQALESAVVELAACEIFARAQQSYINQMGTVEAMNAIRDMLNKTVGAQVSQECYNDLNPSQCNIPSESDINRCANTRYSKEVIAPMQDYVKKLWPAKPTPAQDCVDPGVVPPSGPGHTSLTLPRFPASSTASRGGLGLSSLLLFAGSCAPERRRRRRRSGARRPLHARAVLAVTANLVVLSVTCYFGAGCDSGNSPQYPSPVISSPPTPQSSPPGGSPIVNSIGNAGGAIGGFNSLMPTAAGLVGQKGTDLKTVAPPGGFGNSLQAAAGDVVPHAHSNSAPSAGSPGGGPNNEPTRAHGGGSAAAGGGGGNSDFGNLKTSAFPDPDAGGAAATAGGVDTGSAYKSGGAGGPAQGSGDAPTFSRGSSISGTNGEQSFGNDDASGAAASTMGSEDPADYFTRTGLDENIFKVVERRYKQKQLTWATDSDSKTSLKAPEKGEKSSKHP